MIYSVNGNYIQNPSERCLNYANRCKVCKSCTVGKVKSAILLTKLLDLNYLKLPLRQSVDGIVVDDESFETYKLTIQVVLSLIETSTQRATYIKCKTSTVKFTVTIVVGPNKRVGS